MTTYSEGFRVINITDNKLYELLSPDATMLEKDRLVVRVTRKVVDNIFGFYKTEGEYYVTL
jgi:hypothetical protein